MKKIFLLSLIICFCTNAQKVIVEEALGKDKPRFQFKYSLVMNKMFINEASNFSYDRAVYNKSFLYDENSNKEILITDGKFNFHELSDNGIDFMTVTYEAMLGPFSVMYHSNNKLYEFGRVDNYLGSLYFFDKLFTDQFQLKIVDSKGKRGMSYEKDPFYLEKTDYTKKTSKKIPIKKPNFLRLKGESLLKVKDIGCFANIVDNKSFEIITKSISKDLTSCTMYRTIYDLDGKITNDYEYSYTLSKGQLVRCSSTIGSYSAKPIKSVTKPTQYGTNGPLLDLGINQHFIDPITKDVYIYGLYMDEFPAGYYLIKFNNEGEKIWEKQYPIQDKKGFNNKRQFWHSVNLGIDNYMDDKSLSFSIQGRGNEDTYNHFFLIDKEKGELKKQVYRDCYTETTKGGIGTLAKSSIFEINRIMKNRYSDVNTITVYVLNEKVKSYVDNLTSKKDICFNSIISSNGIWLVETDNHTYYKVTLFKN